MTEQTNAHKIEFDERDQLWNANYETYYNCCYYEIACEKVINKWQLLDVITKTLVATTASGSAISGWTLWHNDNFKYVWAIIAGLSALLAIVHSTLSVPNKLKQWEEIKGSFASLRIDLETLKYQMSINPIFSVDTFTQDFINYRKKYCINCQSIKEDILWTKRLEIKSQEEINERLFGNEQK